MSATSPDTGRLPGAGTSPAAAGTPPRRLGLALAVIATAQLMVVLDPTIVNVALPHIQDALHFSGSSLEWVVNGYTLAFGGLPLLVTGSLIAAGGRRPAAGSFTWPSRRRTGTLAPRPGRPG